MTYHGKTSRFRILLPAHALSALVAMGTPAAMADTPADTLVEAWAIDDIISLDPAEAFELSTGEITGNTYDMLVRLDANDTTKVIPGIAESWTVSDDGLTYTFKLKPGIKFASGNPITAEDVAWSFERAVKLNKSPASSSSSSASPATTSPKRPRRSIRPPSSSPSTRAMRRASC